MAAMNHHQRPWLLQLLFLFFIIIIPFSDSQSPQNIETFYPFSPEEPPAQPPAPYNNSPNSTPFPPSSTLPPPPSPPPVAQQKSPPSSTNRKIAWAVAATAASSFVAATLLFCLIQRVLVARRRKKVGGAIDDHQNPPSGGTQQPAVLSDQFARVEGNIKGLIVDENGLDVLYWRNLQEENKKSSYRKKVFHGLQQQGEEEGGGNERVVQTRSGRRRSEPIQEVPLLRGKSSTSHLDVVSEISSPDRILMALSALSAGNNDDDNNNNTQSSGPVIEMKTIGNGNQNLTTTLSSNHPVPPRPALPLPPSMAVPKKQGPSPPPAPPPPMTISNNRQSPATAPPPPPPPSPSAQTKKDQAPPPPPPPPPAQMKKDQAPPPPPPPPFAKKNQSPPPAPPPKGAGLATSSKLPPDSKGKQSENESGESSNGDNGQVKLKPLHWDKVHKNADHSMVWDKIDGGSFRFDDDLMEALFGYVATNRKSPRQESNSASPKSRSPPAQIVILEGRRSQNIAIVLKSLAISRSEILDALNDGQGLDADTLEKLVRIAPTKEEESQILEFSGDRTRLADAESFLYHLLRAVPSAFKRLNAMLFRSNYDAEIIQFKETLQTLESGCKELRNRGLFMKLLEAVLKAGNRMNAGTSRGNAQAFKLSSLRKLSDVKSTDGKTTLLHFIVEEVVRSEGKRCVLNRNRSLSRSGSSRSSNSSIVSENGASKEEREKEYIMLGLPIVGGLSAEFNNVKKAALVDYETFAGTCPGLLARVKAVRQIVSQCATNREGGGFVKEMKAFLDRAEAELKGLKEEEMRTMEVVKRTTEYYQAGASKDQGAHPLQLFVIIKDFLGMVDQACIAIARNMQKRKTPSSSLGSSPKSPASRTPVRFPNLPEHFLEEKSRSISSESDTDF